MNFYNIAGIRFQNIAANDALISSKLSDMTENGWELVFVTRGVEADARSTNGQAFSLPATYSKDNYSA